MLLDPVLLDEKGNELHGNDVSGLLCIRNPVPGIARSVFGDFNRYMDTYWRPFPGYYFTGDGAYRDPEGHLRITGRVDDVINVSGHRLGTAEVETALTNNDYAVEAAVVGFPHDVKGEGIYAFVVLRQGLERNDEARVALKESVKRDIGSWATPDKIQLCAALPKTRSGKIMRRILRKIAMLSFDDLGDISTLAEPAVVERLIQERENIAAFSSVG
eukprot:NODE_1521_length_1139_cov_22.441284_g1239_i0.p1 GENE.NODE_1521_length_1139_cov_22.441284_g1239_i0~~NODE_1521_length_1139_cov_22.441284_g1239_i0.p1  ORF type:complete len:216 (-),score=55.91 NODE_1521_length_1139_cov_22.441284_g1239_i0:429-1076(-)